MCRLLVYFGKTIYLNEIIYNPEHSIIKQSYSPAYTPNIKKNVLNSDLNLDGFGCGWWIPEKNNFFVYKSLKPIWNDTILNSIANSIKSNLIFAHIRAVLRKRGSPVSDLNTHPFIANGWIWMHNGCIIDFDKHKGNITSYIESGILPNLYGSTDSEFCFGLYLTFLTKNSNPLESFTFLFKYLKKNNFKGYYNFITSDGINILCSRFVIGINKEPLSLYFDEKKKIISSEPLYPNSDWIVLPKNSMLHYKENNYKIYNLSKII